MGCCTDFLQLASATRARGKTRTSPSPWWPIGCMIAGLVLPDFFGDAVIDLKEHFFAHRRWFFFLAFGTIVVSVAKEVVLDNRLQQDESDIWRHFRCVVFVRCVHVAAGLPQGIGHLCHRTLYCLHLAAVCAHAIVMKGISDAYRRNVNPRKHLTNR